MDSSYESSDDEAEAMAKTMGFSSFGTQGPPKKRKYNLKADAMVEGQELASIDRGGKKGHGSGGNDIPLGKPRLLGIASKRNQEEIELDEDEEEPAYIDISLPPPLKLNGSDEGGPVYTDTTLLPPNENARAAQEKINAILASCIIPPLPPDSKTQTKSQVSDIGRSVSGFIHALKDESKSLATNVLASTTSYLHTDRNVTRQRGQINELWYINYYDPSFNENPWAKLERANGIGSKGTWIEKRGHTV